MALRQIKLKNDILRTECIMKVPSESGYFTKDQIKRAKRVLCGSAEKARTHGGALGEHGPQEGVSITVIQGKFVHYDTREAQE